MTKYKCCLCKKSTTVVYFHHFTPKMKERYQCIHCRFDNDPVSITKAKEYSKSIKKQIKFLDSLLKVK